MNWEKEAYSYENYFGSLKGAKVTPVYNPLVATGHSQIPKAYSPIAIRSYSFLNSKSDQDTVDSMDFFKQKLDLSQDKTNLILDQINDRDKLKNDNLKSLYADLLQLDNWRLEHDPTGYLIHDKQWHEHNKMEMDLKDKIRKELNESSKSMAFPEKDLRDSLLEFKLQKSKSEMLGGGLDDLLIEPDGSYETNRGDYDPPQESNE